MGALEMESRTRMIIVLVDRGRVQTVEATEELKIPGRAGATLGWLERVE